jgi:hypothetical protein
VQFIGKNGQILKEVADPTAVYDIQGSEGYVRARVLESNGRIAWCQPALAQPRLASLPAAPMLWGLVILVATAGVWRWRTQNTT